MTDSNIYITITDEPLTTLMGVGQTNNQSGNQSQSQGALPSGSSTAKQYIQKSFFDLVGSQAKQIANYSINNIGNFTGNYQTQRQVNEMLNIANRFKNIGFSALAGLQFGGPAGAVFGAVISAASMAVGDFLQYNSTVIETQQQNREISILRNISGLDTLNNGSRWGG